MFTSLFCPTFFKQNNNLKSNPYKAFFWNIELIGKAIIYFLKDKSVRGLFWKKLKWLRNKSKNKFLQKQLDKRTLTSILSFPYKK